MESPLTPEIVEELKKISKLNVEEQKRVLPNFLKKLTPEQIDYIRKQQGQEQGGCLFCSIVNGDVPVKKVYEDENYLAFLDIRPANPGHTLVIPKDHVQFSTQLGNANIFEIANKIANSIFEKMRMDTNIFVANGVNAGQRLDHLVVHVIPRGKDDGIAIGWHGKEVKEEDLNEIALKIKVEPLAEVTEVKKETTEERKEEEIEYDDFRIP